MSYSHIINSLLTSFHRSVGKIFVFAFFVKTSLFRRSVCTKTSCKYFPTDLAMHIRAICILRPYRDQLRKMQLQGLQLGIEPATSGSLDQRSTDWATEAVAWSMRAYSIYIYIYIYRWQCRWSIRVYWIFGIYTNCQQIDFLVNS